MLNKAFGIRLVAWLEQSIYQIKIKPDFLGQLENIKVKNQQIERSK